MLQASIFIHNCEDRASGKCQLFQTWRFGPEMTNMVTLKHQIWTPIIEKVQPPLKFPITPVSSY